MSMIWIYLSIALAGALFFIASLFHGDADVHDFHGHSGGAEHHDGIDGNVDHGTSFKDFLSLRSIALMLLGFGLTSAIMTSLGIFGVIIPISAFFVGLVLAYFGIKAVQFMIRQEATTTSSLSDYNGQNGTVVIEISESGIGQVLVASVTGEERYLTARSFDGGAINSNQPIEVVGAVGGDLLVRKVNSLPRSI